MLKDLHDMMKCVTKQDLNKYVKTKEMTIKNRIEPPEIKKMNEIDKWKQKTNKAFTLIRGNMQKY